jgi:hypothetical protein
MSNIVKILFTVFIIAFSSLTHASSKYAPYSRGVVVLNPDTGAIVQCTSDFNVVTPTTICKKIGSTPVDSINAFYISIVKVGLTENAIITNVYAGIVTQCTLLSTGTGSCKTDYLPK